MNNDAWQRRESELLVELRRVDGVADKLRATITATEATREVYRLALVAIVRDGGEDCENIAAKALAHEHGKPVPA